MPNDHRFSLAEEDLAPLKAAQKLIRENLADLPLEVLVPIAIRSVNAHFLASEVLSTITGREGVISPDRRIG